jgi:hypothetical protein
MDKRGNHKFILAAAPKQEKFLPKKQRFTFKEAK